MPQVLSPPTRRSCQAYGFSSAVCSGGRPRIHSSTAAPEATPPVVGQRVTWTGGHSASPAYPKTPTRARPGTRPPLAGGVHSRGMPRAAPHLRSCRSLRQKAPAPAPLMVAGMQTLGRPPSGGSGTGNAGAATSGTTSGDHAVTRCSTLVAPSDLFPTRTAAPTSFAPHETARRPPSDGTTGTVHHPVSPGDF